MLTKACRREEGRKGGPKGWNRVGEEIKFLCSNEQDVPEILFINQRVNPRGISKDELQID